MIREILIRNGHPVPITRAVVQNLCALGVDENDIQQLQELAHEEYWTPEKLADALISLGETVLSEAPSALQA